MFTALTMDQLESAIDATAEALAADPQDKALARTLRGMLDEHTARVHGAIYAGKPIVYSSN